jgi:amino acid permease
MSLQALLRTKSVEQLQSEIGGAGQFRRVLGLWQLTAIGLGGLIGAGIFVLTGVAAATQAGPAVSLSFYWLRVLAFWRGKNGVRRKGSTKYIVNDVVHADFAP